MATVYKWKPQADLELDPQAAGEELERLRIKNNGSLTPRSIVEAAKPKDSPLHGGFEWDDKKAAAGFRENQASYILRQIIVEMPDSQSKTPVRAFVSVTLEKKPVYTSTAVAMADDEMRAQVLARAWHELIAWRERYRELEAFGALFAQIDADKPKTKN